MSFRFHLEYSHTLCLLDSSGQIMKSLREVPLVTGKIGDYGLLSTTALPKHTYVIRHGFLYSRQENEEDGLECVIRYKIKNWDQIKEAI